MFCVNISLSRLIVCETLEKQLLGNVASAQKERQSEAHIFFCQITIPVREISDEQGIVVENEAELQY
jgi:hypothetical protein